MYHNVSTPEQKIEEDHSDENDEEKGKKIVENCENGANT
jgi:hypothetical protein